MGIQLPRYLVLGGSRGIGFAFARLRAPQSAEFIVVARHLKTLERACDQLRVEGAKKTRAVPLDLSNTGERRKFLRKLAHGPSFDGIFVGGPSPPPGPYNRVTSEMAATAYEVVVQYPLEVMDLARTTLRRGGTLTILSSSASKEQLFDHEFFLSAAMRRILDTLATELKSVMSDNGQHLIVWRPKVVLTDLSLSYAKKQGGVKSKEDAIEWLKLRHRVPEVLTAMEFVRTMEQAWCDDMSRALT